MKSSTPLVMGMESEEASKGATKDSVPSGVEVGYEEVAEEPILTEQGLKGMPLRTPFFWPMVAGCGND
ncbi:hypothetical protein, partial [Magnetococcus sp. PR-3]|uniref:hypothetical protein n=1 Tax=Magnetococcus sp. PR-3 TaxID=3120355 RepID=UPI002FCE0FEA